MNKKWQRLSSIGHMDGVKVWWLFSETTLKGWDVKKMEFWGGIIVCAMVGWEHVLNGSSDIL